MIQHGDDLHEAAALAARGMRNSESALLEVFRELQELHEQALDRPRALVAALFACVEARDPYTGAHCSAVHDIAVLVCAEIRLTPEDRDEVRAVALLHDLGKLALPDAILRKRGPLDAMERAEVELHPVLGERILASVPGLDAIARGVRHEHERWDGTGYPDRLAGDVIPLSARIVAACDAYHALVSDRPYRPGVTPAEALAEVVRGSGTQFDPAIAVALQRALDDGVEATPRPPVPELFAAGAGNEPLLRELRALVRLATATGVAQGFDEVMEAAAEEVLVALGATAVTISRWEADHGWLRVLLNAGELLPSAEPRPEHEVYTVAGYPPMAALVERGEATLSVVDDAQSPPEARAWLARAGRESDLSVPILVDDQLWGELHASTGIGVPRFGPRQLRLLEAMAGMLATAVGRSELFARISRLAYEDPLTGLANRRALDRQLEDALDVDEGALVSLVVADVDAFKELNDRHGHDEGDRVLQAVAHGLSAAASELPGTLVARSGGDEFCAVLTGRPLADAEAFCRNAGRRITALDGPAVTLAWGAASSADGPGRPGDLFRRADAAQYAAKRAGRGRICLNGPETPMPLPVRPARRRLRDATRTESAWLVPAAMEALDALERGAAVLDRLATVGAVFAGALDAAGWDVSSAPEGTGVLVTRLGELTVLDPQTGRRMTRVHMEDEWVLSEFPATVRAVDDGVGFHAARGAEDSDPDELRALEELGYESVLGAGARRDGEVWIVEVFGDARTPPFVDAVAHLRAAVAAAVAYASRAEPS